MVGSLEAWATPSRATEAAKARSDSRTSGRRPSSVAGSESGTCTASTASARLAVAGMPNGIRPTSVASSCSRWDRSRRACASAAAGTATSLSNWCTSSSEMTPALEPLASQRQRGPSRGERALRDGLLLRQLEQAQIGGGDVAHQSQQRGAIARLLAPRGRRATPGHRDGCGPRSRAPTARRRSPEGRRTRPARTRRARPGWCRPIRWPTAQGRAPTGPRPPVP